MSESYIKDYQIKLFEDIYTNDLERLKAINYGLDYILNNIQFNLETPKDKKNYNTLTTCFLKISDIIKEEDNNNNIPLF